MRRRALAVTLLALVAPACDEPAIYGSGAYVRPAKPAWRPPAGAASATPEDSYRQAAPAVSAAAPPELPNADEATLPNGVRVIVLPRHAQPIVALRAVVSRGAAQAPPGVAPFAGAMLFEGTWKDDREALHRKLNEMGATHSSNGSYDAVWVDVKVAAPNVAPAFDTLAEVVRAPSFPEDRMDAVRDRLVDVLDQARSTSRQLAAERLVAMSFPPSHPYHLSPYGDAAILRGVKRSDVYGFWLDAAVPELTTVIVAGDISAAAAVDGARARFGDWSGAAKPPKPLPFVGDVAGPRVVVLDRPGDSQCQVLLGWLTADRVSLDIVRLQVLASALARSITGKLDRVLRGERGVTYGVQAWVSPRIGPSSFLVSAAVERDATAEAIRSILAEIGRLRTEPLEEADMPPAKTSVDWRTWNGFETLGAIVGTLTPAGTYHEPLERLMERLRAPRSVGAADVQAVAAKYLAPEAARIVVVGDAARVKGPLEAAGLGEIVVEAAPVVRKAVED